MANIIVWAIVALILYFVGTMYLGVAGIFLVTVFILSAMLLLNKFLIKGKIPFVSMLFKGKWAMYAGIIGMVFVMFSMGWLTGIIGGIGLPAVIEGIGAVPEEIPSDTCWNMVDENIRGTSVTVILNAYDKQSETSTLVGGGTIAFPYGVYYEDGTKVQDVDIGTGNVSAAMGKTITIRGGNATYYLEEKIGVCVPYANFPVTLNAHKVQTEGNMAMTVYDDTGTTELTGGLASIHKSDYNLTIGATEEKLISIKLKNNAADAAYQFCGYGTIANGDIDGFYPVAGQGFTKDLVPKYMKNIDILLNDTTPDAGNLTQYDSFYYHSPVLLSEWKSVKYEFTVKAGATDPAYAAPTVTSDVFIAMAADCAFMETGDGSMVFGYYAKNNTEDNAGLAETVTSPVGKETGFIGTAL